MVTTGQRLAIRLAVMLLLAVHTALAQPATDQNTSQHTALENSEIYKAAELLSIMVECPERLWPNYNWEHYQVIFIDAEQDKAVFWNDQSQTGEGPILSFPPASRFDRYVPGLYQFIKYKDARTMFMRRKQSQDFKDLIYLAIHEGFHNTGQSKMPSMKRRGEFYPEAWRARYLRRELMNSLRRAIKKKGRKGLPAAAYWRRKLL